MKNPDDIDAQLIAKYRRDGKAPPREVAHVLATICMYQRAYGPPPPEHRWGTEVLVPTEVIDMCAEIIAGKSAWAREQNRVRRGAAKKRWSPYQTEANRIWKRHPHFSETAVAVELAKTSKAKVGTIRRRITKPVQDKVGTSARP